MFSPLQKLLFTLCWFLPFAGLGQVALNPQTPKFTGRYKRELPKYKMDSSTTAFYFRKLAELTIKTRKMQTGPPFPSDFVDWLASCKKNGLKNCRVFNNTTVACHFGYRIGLTNTGKRVTQPFPLRFIRNPEDFISDHTMVSRLNTNQRADAYPWLSADGLRLYFIAERPGMESTLYYAERCSAEEPFVTSCRLSQHFEGDIRGATLTSDEKTVYLHIRGRIYVSARKSREEEFPAPVQMEGATAYGMAPAISPDGMELGVLRGGRYLVYDKNSEGKFVLSDSIPIYNSFRASPGQFSKDGLDFYTTLESMNGSSDTSMLVRYKRKSLDQSFRKFEILLTQNAQPLLKQVTVNGDGTIMIGVSTRKEWMLNELTGFAKDGEGIY